MKRLLFLFLVSLVGCSDSDQQWNYIHVDIKEPNQNQVFNAGDNYRLIADISTPNTLRAITIFIGNKDVPIKSLHSNQKHFIDTTFRIEPTKTTIIVRVRAEDNVGNYEDKITLSFSPYQLPQACIKTNSIAIVAAIPLSSPVDENTYIHGDFNNNLLADNNYRLVPIPGTTKCSCISIPLSQDMTLQFNRGSQTSINQSYNCHNVYFGFSGLTPTPVGIILDRWKDIDCN